MSEHRTLGVRSAHPVGRCIVEVDTDLYDPWSGGAYEVAALPEVVKLVAPKQPHGAMLTSLTAADRDLALRKLEQWIGARPNLAGAPPSNPAMPRVF